MKKIESNKLSQKWWNAYCAAEECNDRKDHNSAMQWYRKAISDAQCNPIVFFEIGYLYQHGFGVDMDLAQAVEWYEKAAEKNVPQAYYALAYFYHNGVILTQDAVLAVNCLQKATALMRELQIERDIHQIELNERERSLVYYQESLAKSETNLEVKKNDLEKLHLEYHDLLQRKEIWTSEKECMLAELENQRAVITKLQTQLKNKQQELALENRSYLECERFVVRYQSQVKSAEMQVQAILKENSKNIMELRTLFEQEKESLCNRFDREIKEMKKETQAFAQNNVQLERKNAQYLQEVQSLQSTLESLRKEYKMMIFLFCFLVAGLFLILVIGFVK